MNTISRTGWPKAVFILPILLSVLVGSDSGCSQRAAAQEPKASGTAAHFKRMADGKQWTTRNLNVEIAPSYCYDNQQANCARYGRLYAWESAQRVCRALGEEWRLPTDEEWRQLAKNYGGVSADAADGGKASYQALLTGGRSGFEAVLGGGRSEDGQYGRLEAHGFYWTASQIDAGHGWFYNFGKGGLALHRQDGGEKQRAFSVRCVREEATRK